MSLPFRRRHNDAEASHDRARALIANGFLEPMEPADAAWLEGHLAGCADCRADLEAFGSDRQLLRGLREAMPTPPRDLWARTAAAIERDAGRTPAGSRRAGTRPGPGVPRVGRLPLGVLSGALVILVVVATSLAPRTAPQIFPSQPAASQFAFTTEPDATPLAVTAKGLNWVQEQSDGTFQLVFANVDEVCTADPEACAPIDDASTTRLTLPSEPESVVLSKNNDQLVVVTAPTDTGGGDILVVPVPAPVPTGGPGGTPGPSPSATPEPTAAPTPSFAPTPVVPPSLGPSETPLPTPVETVRPDGSRSILSGVVVVGEAAYSAGGDWLAFSARPIDGSSGPDLYVWHVGDTAGASAVTSDHRTFFAGWLGDLILASRVESAIDGADPAPDASASPVPEGGPTPRPGKTPKPPKGPTPTPSPSQDATASLGPETSPDTSAAPAEDRPVSFLFDPETTTVIDLAGANIWRPVVDPKLRTIVYWSGTLVPNAAGTGWDLGTGQLVLDRWLDPTAEPGASPGPGASSGSDPTPPPPTATSDGNGLATMEPTASPGPAGAPVLLADGPISDFDVSFDPTGRYLAVWIRDPQNEQVGTLRLVVLDPETGVIDPAVDPLPAASALRGVSIDEGRLAWVTPPGQDGESSHVNVLAWSGGEFGQVRSIAGDRLFVVR